MQDAFSEEFEKVEIDLFGVGVLLLVDAGVEGFHVQDDAQESVHLLLRHVLQVGHMVRWAGRNTMNTQSHSGSSREVR